jgi:O-antigen/teichoic acid export membrane protein
MLNKIIATIFTRGFVAIINLSILLISAKQLGGDVRGQISLFLLNIAIVQTINEIFTGYALVYFIPKSNIKSIYKFGFLWTILITTIISASLLTIEIISKSQLIHICILSFLIILNSFHGVILLAKQKIKIYNLLMFFQPFTLLLALCISIFIFEQREINSYIISLYTSFSCSFLISLFFVIKVLLSDFDTKNAKIEISDIFKSGFYNQVANLSHMLSNRFNFYLLSTTLMVGVYSSAVSLIESILIISSSISTIILTNTANRNNEDKIVSLTFLLSKISFMLSLLCAGILYIVPDFLFIELLGNDFSDIKSIMLHLCPGIIFISFSTVISHYFSGIGNQKLIALANFMGLLTTISFSYFLINRFQLLGACYGANLSYLISSLVLVVAFVKHNNISLKQFFKLKSELYLLK